jgi:hypothetical protein
MMPMTRDAALQRSGGALRPGDLQDVCFYRSQLAGHMERVYHPGRPD